MSYARWRNGSDVYVYEQAHPLKDCGDGFTCCGCALSENDGTHMVSFHCDTRREMIAHLEAHVAQGHKVPAEAFERLRREIVKGLP